MENKEIKEVREPLFHIVKRDAMPWYRSWGIRVLSVVAAFFVISFITYGLYGKDPLYTFQTYLDGNFGTENRIWTLMKETALLLGVALAVTPAFKMRFWNIGAEGQVLIGALVCSACLINIGDKLPTALLLLVVFVTSMLAGAVWGLIPAFFKAHWNANETLFTLMMNYIATSIVSCFCYIWSGGGSGKVGIINPDTKLGWLPEIADHPETINIIIVLVLTVILFIYLKYSKHGYEISVVGESENTARYIGINVKKVILRTMALSGALCGLVGVLLVCGVNHTITTSTAGGRGFTAIMVSWLAKFNPLYMIVTSFLIIFLEKGAKEITIVCNASNDSFPDIVSGLAIFFIIGSEFFINYKIKFRAKKAKEQKEVA